METLGEEVMPPPMPEAPPFLLSLRPAPSVLPDAERTTRDELGSGSWAETLTVVLGGVVGPWGLPLPHFFFF